MTRVLVLLVLFVVAGGAAAFLKWEEWSGNSDPVRETKDQSTEQAAGLPPVVHEKIPVHLLLGRDRAGMKRNITKPVADALVMLAIEGGVDLTKLTSLARQKKVPIDVLTELPGADSFDVKTIEEFGTTGAVSKDELLTIARDRQVPVSAIKELGRRGLIPAKFSGPLEVLTESGALPMDEFHVKNGQLLVETDTLLVGTRQVKAIEITDQQNEMIRIERAVNGGPWVVPDRFGAKVTTQRVKMLCRALDGLGRADRRGSTEARHKVYEVEGDAGMRMRLEDEQGETIVNLRVGKQDAPQPNAQQGRAPRMQSTYVRPVGSANVFRHGKALQPVAHSGYNAWLDLRFFDHEYEVVNAMIEDSEKTILEFDDVEMGPKNPRQADVTYSGKRLRYVLTCEKTKKDATGSTGPSPTVPGMKDYERTWAFVEPEDAKSLKTNTMMVDSVARMILNGRKEDIVGTDADNPEYGFDKPVCMISVAFKDGTTHTLKVGNRVPVEGEVPEHQVRSRYAHITGDPFVMKISEYSVRSMMRKPENLQDPRVTDTGKHIKPGTPGLERPKILDPDEREKEDSKKKPGGKDTEKAGESVDKKSAVDKKPGGGVDKKPTADKKTGGQ